MLQPLFIIAVILVIGPFVLCAKDYAAVCDSVCCLCAKLSSKFKCVIVATLCGFRHFVEFWMLPVKK